MLVDPAEFASAPRGLKVRRAAVTPQVRGKVVAARGFAPPLHALKERLPELLEDAAKKETAARLAVPLNAQGWTHRDAETRGNEAPARGCSRTPWQAAVTSRKEPRRPGTVSGPRIHADNLGR